MKTRLLQTSPIIPQESDSNREDRRPTRSDRGFTMGELLVVISIIATLIALLVPAVHRKREAANNTKCVTNLQAIFAAQNDFHEKHQFFARSLEELGLGTQFPTGQRDGYNYDLLVPGSNPGIFYATGTPAAPGITGSVACRIDQTGKLISEPVPGADEARRQMFFNINQRAAMTIAGLLATVPSHLRSIADFLQSPEMLNLAFAKLFGDDGGAGDIKHALEYSGSGATQLAGLLPYIEEQMQLGLAGEDVDAIPGVSLSDLLAPSPTHDAVVFDAQITGGSRLRADGGRSMASLCDGSVRPAGDAHVLQERGIQFSQAHFLADLGAVQSAGSTTLAGPFSFTDRDGNSLRGIVIGVFPPRTPRSLDSAQVVDAIVVATEGTGLLAGAPGCGGANIALRSDPFASINGTLQLKPFGSIRR